MKKEYMIRTYCPANEPMEIAVFVRADDGTKFVQRCENMEQAKEFMATLDKLGFVKKRRLSGML